MKTLEPILRRFVGPCLFTVVLAYYLPKQEAGEWPTQLNAAALTCESLATLTLPNAKITSAQTVAAGAFTPPSAPARAGGGGAGRGPNYAELPAFCRIAATLTPSTDSDIKVEVWLPVAGWNRKYQAVGNGGWAGVISYAAMAEALKRGYATSSTDTGHVGGSGSFALGHPEKLVDYAYRSVHEMTVKSKTIIDAFYGNAPQYSYWNGCSTGGKQGLAEAQRYPGDFDGIIAGAPANYMIHLHAWSVWVGQAVHKTAASYIPPDKYPVLRHAVLAACDTLDGVKDGLLEEPTRCRFDPKVVQCESGDGPACLTAAQVDAARTLYSPAVNPRTKKEVFPAMMPGSEMTWNVLAGPEPVAIATDTFKYVIFKDPNWDYRTLNFDRDIALADKVDNGLNNAIDPNLKPFFGRGGKLLMYHGWDDALIAPGNSVNYYNSVVKAVGGPAKAGDSIRLFMAPGMDHCRGGAGPNVFDAVTAIEQWVEQKKAPEVLTASHSTGGKVDRTRPLCLYPQTAKYRGTGSIDEAANFVCSATAHLDTKAPKIDKRAPTPASSFIPQR
jgi:feruloyl esterase